MTDFVSDIKTIPYGNRAVYETLSDLNNLERVKNQAPSHKIEDFTFDRDFCSFSISPVGKICLSIVAREPLKTIKFSVDQAPVEATIWIQLKGVGEQETKMKLTLRANLNPFIKPIMSKPLQESVDQFADLLSKISYETLA